MSLLAPASMTRTHRTASAPRRPSGLTPAQLLARRNDDWLRDAESGRPVALIAALYGVTRQTVRNGLAAARETREAIARALHAPD